jgi:putative DNA primase/helicase
MRCTEPSFWHNLSAADYRRATEYCAGPAISATARELRWRTHGSLSFDPRKGVFNDFEAGCGGDLVAFVIHTGMATDFPSAVRVLEDALGGKNAPSIRNTPKPPDGAKNHSQAARAIWGETTPLSRTLGAQYLIARAIPAPWPVTLRFHPSLYCGEAKREIPAIVGAIVDLFEPLRVQAVQRIYLGPDGRKAKIKTPKASLGPCAGRGVILGRIHDALCVAEGIESALSASRALGLPAVATLGTSGMAALRIPMRIQRVVIAHDRDKNGAGERAANKLAARLHYEGRQVEFAPPPDGFGDWNDAAQAMKAANV